VAGRVVIVNDAVLADPSLVERDPYGAGWLVELEADDPAGEFGRLVSGEVAVAAWFAAEVEGYRLKGVLAE
jgi:glycine cleavage system H protein